MKCLIILLAIISLNAHSKEQENKKDTHCDKIYDRVYIDLYYKCLRLNPVKQQAMHCQYEVAQHIKEMIEYCKEQESKRMSIF